MRRVAGLAIVAVIATTIPASGAPRPAGSAAKAVAAQGSGKRAWSEPATWGGKIPSAGDTVTIPGGTHVVLDTSTPRLGGLQVDGKLSFARRDVELRSNWIMVHGTFQVGSAKKPFTDRAVIELTGSDPDEDVMGMGTSVFAVMGDGSLELHGKGTIGWTRLAATAEEGDDRLLLERAVPWRPGDEIAIASTSYRGAHDEERTITHVDGDAIELDRPLDRQHWGEVQTFQGHQVDERAEVALLSRNVKVRGASERVDEGFGGNIMVMNGAKAHVEGVELEHMGQRNILRRYPIHFHMVGDAGRGSYIKRSSIHHSFNRCMTIHGTNMVKVTGNVCFDHVGHGFFFEDGAETDNVLRNNLGFGTRSVEDGLLPSDRNAATYWITNPDNRLIGNVAAGSDGTGFWLALPKHPTGLSENDDVWPRRTPLGRFSGNVAHSNYMGVNVDDGPRPDGRTESAYYDPVEDPTDPESASVVATFEGLTAYMNRDRGIWLRGENHVVTSATLADNRSGATFASSESFLEDSIVVGETANKGTPDDWEETGPGGRALPFFWEPEAQVTGFEFYDGRVGTRNTTFVNFRTNDVRPAGALGYLAHNAFSIHPRNFAEQVSFLNSNRVYLAPPDEGMDGDNSKVFVDADGSVTGAPGKVVVIDNPFLVLPGCEFNDDWNAHLCDAGYTSLMVGTRDGDPAAIKPVILTREDGAAQSLMGCCDESTEAWTTVLADRTYDVEFSALPDRFRFVLWRGKGRSVTVRLDVPGGVEIDRWGWPIERVDSPGQLAAVDDSAYHYGNGTLTLRLVGSGDWEEIRISRP